MKIASIVGARPQFIKLAPVSREFRKRNAEIVVHTGQHYDYKMSEVFFRELGIPAPDYHLGVGSNSHGKQTGEMLAGIESVLLAENPDWVVVFGDTNSTLAGALAAAKLRLPIAHVESGLRSYDRTMPEEINRVLTDHVADLLLCPTRAAVANLTKEGIRSGVHQVGDVMHDVLLRSLKLTEGRDTLQRFGVAPERYLLATIHRASNTDDPERLDAILSALEALSETIVFPVHPRTYKMLKSMGRQVDPAVRLTEPVGYLDMVALERNARMILTDSGGVQKEAYILGVPCITLRDETEWVETVEAGWNIPVGTDKERIIGAVASFKPKGVRPELFGDGHASERIAALLEGNR